MANQQLGHRPEDAFVQQDSHAAAGKSSARSQRSRMRQAQVVGVEEAFRIVATLWDTTTDLALTPGALVKLRVLARNASGPGMPSGEVLATVPALVAV